MKRVFFSLIAILCSILHGTAGVYTPPSSALTDGNALIEHLTTGLLNGEFNGKRIEIPKGEYYIDSESLMGRHLYITNHDMGDKHIAFPIIGCRNIVIDGNGSKFIFRGQVMPFMIENSENITIKELSIDWDIPFFVQGTIVDRDSEGEWYDVELFKDGFRYKMIGDCLRFPDVNKFSFKGIGESLIFDAKSRAPIVGSSKFDIHRRGYEPSVERVSGNRLRVYEKLAAPAPLGSIISFKGEMGENRYSPAIYSRYAKGTVVENVTIHHALGMGFLGEFTEDITLDGLIITPSKDRIVSTTADATHFCNCKGEINLINSQLRGMLDDGVNIHGTYTEVVRMLSSNEVLVKLKHFQQRGYKFAFEGDELWTLRAPSPVRADVVKVAAIEHINSSLIKITLKNKLREPLKKGDMLENKSWNSESMLIDNCVMEEHRARNIVIKAPGKVTIQNNTLSSMMSPILLRNEGYLWFESGAVDTLVIRNNRFVSPLYGKGKGGAVLDIATRFTDQYNKDEPNVDYVLFEDNTIVGELCTLVRASQVSELNVIGNSIEYENQEGTVNTPIVILQDVMGGEISNNISTHPITEPYNMCDKSDAGVKTENFKLKN